MFKIGCSVAKKILAIDGGRNSASGSAGESSSSKKSKAGSSSTADKQQQQHHQQQQQSPSEMSKPRTADNIDDFSKLKEDPRIPLSVRQIFKITKSWKAIARTMSRTGTAMFLK